MDAKMRCRRWMALWATCSLSACSTTYIPVVTPGTRCELPAAMQNSCAAPTRLEIGLTYADLLRFYQADRKSLQDCATRQEAALKAVTTCNAEIDRLNADLAKLNDAVKAR